MSRCQTTVARDFQFARRFGQRWRRTSATAFAGLRDFEFSFNGFHFGGGADALLERRRTRRDWPRFLRTARLPDRAGRFEISMSLRRQDKPKRAAPGPAKPPRAPAIVIARFNRAMISLPHLTAQIHRNGLQPPETFVLRAPGQRRDQTHSRFFPTARPSLNIHRLNVGASGSFVEATTMLCHSRTDQCGDGGQKPRTNSRLCRPQRRLCCNHCSQRPEGFNAKVLGRSSLMKRTIKQNPEQRDHRPQSLS